MQTEDNGQTEFQVEIHGAAANTTFNVVVDVAGDGSNLVAVGQITTTAEGEGELEVHNLSGLPALQDGVSLLHLTAANNDPSLAIDGTFSNSATASSQLEANLSDPSNPSSPIIGRAEADLADGSFEVKFFGAAPDTVYHVYVNGDALTGTLVGDVTTQSDGRGKLEIVMGANFPALQAGSTIVVADGNGVTVIAGILASSVDDN